MDHGNQLMKKTTIMKMPALFLLICFASTATAESHSIDQANRMFQINGKLVENISIDVGDKIIFTNKDSVFHNIFSMSDISKFNFGIIGNGESKSMVFNKVGKATIECAIHPRMVLEVDVVKK